MPREVKRPPIEIDRVKRFIQDSVHHISVVYDVVEEVVSEPAVVQSVLDFFWRVGFSLGSSTFARN